MSENHRRSDWQVLGAVALITVGVLLFLNRLDLPWIGLVRQAFAFAFEVAWPVVIIGLGVLVLIGARKGGSPGWSGGAPVVDSGGTKRIMRSRSDRMIGGVLGGLGVYLGIDPTWIRVAFVVLAVSAGFWPAVLIYVVALVLVPEEPKVAAQSPVWPGAASAHTSGAHTAATAPEPPAWVQQPAGATETVQAPEPPAPPASPQG